MTDSEERPAQGASRLAGLFEELEKPLLRYARRLAGCPSAAQDLVQEAFMRLHRQGAAVREPRPWLYRTIHNLAINRLRREARQVPLGDSGRHGLRLEQQESPEPLPHERFFRQETAVLLRRLLKDLAPRKQELLRLKFEERLTYREIGLRTGMSAGNVGYQLHTVIKSLARRIEKNGG